MLKKKMLQKKLKISWYKKILKARIRLSDSGARQIRPKLMPIRVYRIVHTTLKTNPGGVNLDWGRFSKAFTPSRVKKAASPPTAKGITMAIA